MVVAALSNRPRKDHPSCVNCLPNVLLVDTSRYFFDEHRSKAFRSQLLVHAQEVDLSHLDGFVVRLDHSRNTSDKTHELFRPRFDAHSKMPMHQILRRLQCPPQELDRVIKAEHAV